MQFAMRLHSALLLIGLAMGPALVPALALAQSAPGRVSPPGAVETAPLPPPPTGPGGAAPSLPASPSGPAAAPATPPASPLMAGRPTLVPDPGDPTNVDEVILPGKPAAVMSGTSTWDDGFKNLKNAFAKIEEGLTRAGIAPAGRPVTVFRQTDDMGFRYDAMVPIPQAPEGQTTLTPEIRFGKTPEGAALRFVHKSPYEDIDETYETITAYLDAKNITVKDAFIEEYVTDLTEATDPNLEINVFVQPQ
jgi:effector-binding domain-containing protein